MSSCNSSSSTTLTNTTSKCSVGVSRGGSSGGSITIKTVRVPPPQQQQAPAQILLGLPDQQATTFALKQETGGTVMCRVLQLPSDSILDTTQSTVQHTSRGSSGGSITIKTVRVPPPQQQQAPAQILLGLPDQQATTFALKQETGGTVMCRVLQLPSDSILDTTQSTVQHTSHTNVGNGLPALLTASDTTETKLLLAADDDTAAPGTIVASGGQLYLVGEASPSLITGDLPSSSVSSSANISIVTNSNAVTSNSSGVVGSCSLLLPRPLLKSESAPSTVSSMSNSRGRAREDKRRVVHNEVERRRRDKINNWICKLAKILPNCSETQLKNVNMMTSKAGILAKACDYIQEMQRENETLSDTARKHQRLQQELQLLREQNNQLKNENTLLREQLT
ncbi:Myc-type basic helix-loop-helix (bHLH) domain [Trinorchestia longiramus]|nr:Myc-type basic helix-loop-helix (bHLH) domain [Trinorchestia longiramus]